MRLNWPPLGWGTPSQDWGPMGSVLGPHGLSPQFSVLGCSPTCHLMSWPDVPSCPMIYVYSVILGCGQVLVLEGWHGKPIMPLGNAVLFCFVFKFKNCVRLGCQNGTGMPVPDGLNCLHTVGPCKNKHVHGALHTLRMALSVTEQRRGNQRDTVF